MDEVTDPIGVGFIGDILAVLRACLPLSQQEREFFFRKRNGTCWKEQDISELELFTVAGGVFFPLSSFKKREVGDCNELCHANTPVGHIDISRETKTSQEWSVAGSNR